MAMRCGAIEADILPYLQPMMTKFVELLQTPDREVQEMIIATISSTAISAGKEFMPYYRAVLSLLENAMSVTDEQFVRLRCRATECIGTVALAVGAVRHSCSSHRPLPYHCIVVMSVMSLRGCARAGGLCAGAREVSASGIAGCDAEDIAPVRDAVYFCSSHFPPASSSLNYLLSFFCWLENLRHSRCVLMCAVSVGMCAAKACC
jgi:hypothetical protein